MWLRSQVSSSIRIDLQGLFRSSAILAYALDASDLGERGYPGGEGHRGLLLRRCVVCGQRRRDRRVSAARGGRFLRTALRARDADRDPIGVGGQCCSPALRSRIADEGRYPLQISLKRE